MAKRAGLALEKSDSLNEEGLPLIQDPEVGRPWQMSPDPEAMDVELQGQD